MLLAGTTGLTADYDSSSTLLFPARHDRYDGGVGPDEQAASSALPSAAAKFILPFVRWDSVYFLAIAERGYRYEQEHAFMPGLPLLMRAVKNSILYPFTGEIPDRALFALSGILVCNVSTVLAAIALYRLTMLVYKKESLAATTALLFCLSPAAPFLTAIYTEGLFALLSFSGAILFQRRKDCLAALVWSLSGLVRSNGILLVGFFAFRALCALLESSSVRAVAIIKCAIYSLIVLAGFAAFQYYGYASLCVGEPEALSPRPWCAKTPPLLYSFVQEHYWNNGFLRYWTAQQLPNFLLAAPMLAISAAGARRYAQAHGRDTIAALARLLPSRGGRLRRRSATVTTQPPGLRADLPFYALWAALSLYALLFMHVQVVTRLFTSVPAMYWFCAETVSAAARVRRNGGGDDGRKQKGAWLADALLFYFVGYGAVTIVLFANFYPPA
ncbi:GPI mannosyltransferase 2 [Zopfochytrium polystomum]|nr:GPI mannosyltransferase 2 [Zopfochytrium polystomum]